MSKLGVDYPLREGVVKMINDAYLEYKEIAKEYNVSSVYVDTALWQYCAEKKFEMCTEANPKCGECKVKKCNNRKK